MSSDGYEKSVCLVTVTYGNRSAFVEKAVESAADAGVDNIVVIDNGSVVPLTQKCPSLFGNKVAIARLDTNMGSAAAFKTGMQMALRGPCELVLLMDDDNILTRECYMALLKAWSAKCCSHRKDNCIVAAGRAGHSPAFDVRSKSSFLGFHFRDVPGKIYKRMLRGDVRRGTHVAEEVIQVCYAPYSGLLFHRSVLERHGFPEESFVLYADDTEFTYRLTANMGYVGLVQTATLIEQDQSWNASSTHGSFLVQLVKSQAAWRVFYTVRNLCFFEEQFRAPKRLTRNINKTLVFAVLWICCVLRRDFSRWRLLVQAISDARSKRMGIAADPALTLP